MGVCLGQGRRDGPLSRRDAAMLLFPVEALADVPMKGGLRDDRFADMVGHGDSFNDTQ